MFEKAYNWANNAIATEKLVAKSFFQRAEVLVAAAEYNMTDEIDFCDRLVYDLAWEDYNVSYNKGNLNAKMYMNQLEELVTSKGDWFLSADGAQKISPSDKKCLDLKSSDCYKWINRKINTKDN